MARFQPLLPLWILLLPFSGLSEPDETSGAGATSDRATQWTEALGACRERVFSIQADFVQERFDKLGKAEETAEGVVQARRGGLVRIEYFKPERRLLVSDGIVLWAFDKSEKIAFKDDAKKSLLSRIFDFFLNPGQSGFFVRPLEGAGRPSQGPAVLKLVPKIEDTIVESVVLTVTDACPCVKRVLVVDRAGSVLRVTLDNIRTNTRIGKERFTFAPGAGVKVVNP